MEYLIAIVTGVLFACGTYMVLSKRFLKIIFGTSMLTNGTLLFLMTMGKLQRGEAPIIGAYSASLSDPLPQALILTAIVINFGITAFALVLAFQAYRRLGSDNVDEITGEDAAPQTAAPADGIAVEEATPQDAPAAGEEAAHEH